MRCLAPSLIDSWRARAGVAGADFASGHAGGFERHDCGSLFRLAAAQSMAVARAVTCWLWTSEPRTCLVVATERGVWPSSENLALYYAWRRSLQVTTTVDDEPGHEFQPFESHEMVSLVQMALVFGWGVAAVSGDGTAAFAFDDDGVLIAFADSKERAASLASMVPAGAMSSAGRAK